jgi:hypothetical protein
VDAPRDVWVREGVFAGVPGVLLAPRARGEPPPVPGYALYVEVPRCRADYFRSDAYHHDDEPM